MNDRIAKLYFKTVGKEWAYDFDPEIAMKFAELIIRECATVAQAVDDSNTKNVYQYSAAENIKLHFGVE